jgi:DNA polymerase phi
VTIKKFAIISQLSIMVKKRQRESNAESAITDSQPPKRRRQFSEQDQQLAKLYENLADDVSDTRLKAAKELLIELSPEKKLAPELIYKVFNRLIRGLCSGRKAARYGFFIAFTELLRQIYQEDSSYEAEGLPKLNDLVALMVKLTQQEGKAAGQVCHFFIAGDRLR